MVGFTDLPVEMISAIVERVEHRDLYTCALINQQFYLATTPVLWRTLQLPNDGTLVKIITNMVASRHSLGKHVRHVSSDTTALNGYEDGTLNLEKVHKPLTNTKFQQLIRQCPNLRSLRLGGFKLTQNSWALLAKNCLQLVKLDLNALQCLSTNMLSTLAACPLEDLSFDVHIGGPSSVHWTTTEQAVMDLARFPRLKYLAIHGTPTPFIRRLLTSKNNNNPDATTSSSSTPTLPRLTFFVLMNCYQLEDKDIIPFLASQPVIKVLVLIGGKFTDATLNAIATHVPGIGRLIMDHTKTITRRGLCHLIKHCPLLTFVRLHSCGFKAVDFPELWEGDDDVDRTAIDNMPVPELDEFDLDVIRNRPDLADEENEDEVNNKNEDEDGEGQQ